MARSNRVKLKTTVSIGGTEYTCSNVAMHYGLNAVPEAAVSLAVGRDIRSTVASKVHSGKFGFMLPVIIRMQAEGPWEPGSSDDWSDAGRQTLFEGYMTGAMFHKRHGEIQLQIPVIHWLSNLAFSSVFSNQSHPSNPFNYRFSAGFAGGIATMASLKANQMTLLSIAGDAEVFSEDNIQDDLWGKCLAPFFRSVANFDILQLGTSGDSGCFGTEKKNSQSLAALDHIEGDAGSVKKSKWHVPAALAVGNSRMPLAEAIGGAIKSMTVQSMWSTTLWDVLINNICPAFMLSVVPRASTVMIVPRLAGMRKLFDKQIYSRDVDDIKISGMINRPVRGVQLISPTTDDTGAFHEIAWDDGGCYCPDPAAKGMLLVKRVPSWMGTAPGYTSDFRRTVGFGDVTIATATTPASARQSTTGNDDGITAAEIYKSLPELYEKLAKAIYVEEALRGRSGIVQGKLRFDIAPGSNIKVENTGDVHIGESDVLAGDLIGTVARVSTQINAAPLYAGTTMQLSQLRTIDENSSDRTSTADHPLYKSAFVGAPLVDAYHFGG